jgi:hypothetical protein
MSKQYQLNNTDVTKILVGAAITTAAALLTYLTPIISDVDWTIGGTDISPFVVAAWGIFINAARKFLGGN